MDKRKNIYRILRFISSNTKNKIPYFIIILVTFFKIKRITLYYTIYSYLEWIDNNVDNNLSDEVEVEKFLQNQKEILFFNREPNNEFEYLGKLIFLSKHSENYKLLYESFLEIQKNDFKRKFKLLDRVSLENRNIKLGILSLKICASIFKDKKILNDQIQLDTLAKFYIQVDNLIDYKKDYKIGYINIPLEIYSFKRYEEFYFSDPKVHNYLENLKVNLLLKSSQCENILRNYSYFSVFGIFLKSMFLQKKNKLQKFKLETL
ncbi:hypothetical protein [Leptospira interrogans]|uniref:hypothetical protein n=1 Tax=Leptospira interrogans TaxID=173 RepID=UPI000349640C|nr:hypothetical protein [Leptospira interrogans]KAA1268730.1 hypothetical protein C5473_12630 [Leptospira interrogans serovar Weerasinghe]KAA1290778.1 hypothetical protein C4X99_10680 [Leptospira interrogans serovar Geyaweera]QCO34954.1 hypothetical protein E4414_19255 [Leptospira interrogans]QCO39146.1 hypothetical protein E4412_18240 [Leptospira interrogans]QCO42908.1 hypothetical protein E4413_18300 [Leptospira interrogans]